MKRTAFLAITASLFALSAYGEEEKKLNIYNWSDYIAEDTIEKFTAATGIEVTYDVYDSNEVLEAKLLTGSTGYDIVVPTGEFFERQIAAGVYMPLDKAKLPNLKNMDPELMKAAATHDPDNTHGVIYLWGTTGFGYNVDMVKEALGDTAPIDSWALLFDPKNAEKLADCGITILDAPTEVMAAALKYLGLDPNSTAPEDVAKASELLKAVQPFVRYYHSSQHIDDLAAGEVCVSLGWSGDIFQAQGSAAEGIKIAYTIPKEGALQWFDNLAIPKDAPHPENALAFINFVMEPQISADITNYVSYPNANTPATALVAPEIASDLGIYPTPEVKAKLYTLKVKNAEESRLINEAWTAIKSGS